MIESFDPSMVNWARGQFALTALYHFLFVPLTLGMTFIIAIMETIYYKTNSEFWKKTAQFWMKLLAINIAIGIATGIIMEFEFGTNWANYSWFVGDIFGAPLAIEGIFAFFMEATFFAVMFFGWNRVSKKFHLMSTWFSAIGSNLSALWILVANGWMQNPVGTKFNLDLARNEMASFMDVVLNPSASVRFMHVLASAYTASALFIMGISAWYLLKGRHVKFAKASMVVASSFGLLAAIYVAVLGDQSGYTVAQTQPMKLAAMESLYVGERGAGALVFGWPDSSKKLGDGKKGISVDLEIPYLLSIMAHRNPNAFVAGVDDLIYGNEEEGVMGANEKISLGKIAIQSMKDYKAAKASGDEAKAMQAKAMFEKHEKYLGYGHFDKPEELVPSVSLVFWSFHLMVALGVSFIVLMGLVLWNSKKGTILEKKWLLKWSFWYTLLGILAIELGWIVAETGRQPWAIQDLLPVKVAVSNLSAGNVQFSFFGFLILFTILAIAEVKIMIKAIKTGPEGV
jgi:cytochrome d ubiquinol oxidase subunit I